MKVPLLDLKAQYAGLRDDIRRAVDEVCESQYFVLGPVVERFEQNAAQYCGAKHAIGVSSGTDAILVTLMALGIGPGDGVITTPYTFFATAGCIVRLGATPLFADIDPDTFNIDPESVRRLLAAPTGKSKGIKPKVLMPVHLYGQAADMDPLLELAREHDLRVVEDAAQAIGAAYPGSGSARTPRPTLQGEGRAKPPAEPQLSGRRVAGAMGDAGCLSFFPSKNLGGFGDGGMVITSDDELAERIRCLRVHGSAPKYYHGLVGGNFRLDAIQAAVLDVKLGCLERWHEGRRANAARYDAALQGSDAVTPVARYRDSGLVNFHIYNQYVVRVPDRDTRRARLAAAGVGSEVYYPVPLHMQECFKDLGYAPGDFPESERAAAETLALPIYPELTDEMQDYVVEKLTETGD